MGAHGARLARSPTSTSSSSLAPRFLPLLLLLLLLFLFLSLMFVPSLGETESDILLKFKQGLANGGLPDLANWNSSSGGPCNWNRGNWNGVLCLDGTVYGVQLENMELSGTIDVDALASLDTFRTLSLMNNRFGGPMPDVRKLGKLKALYLSNNRLSGEIPADAFQGMGLLKRVFLAHNQFTGSIPSSLTSLPRLMELRLEGNQFQGQIPDFPSKSLKTVNLASNELEGPIPPGLTHLNPHSFSGNKGLCGPPLAPCSSLAESPSSSDSSTLEIFVIILAILVFLLLVAMAAILFYRKSQNAALDRAPSDLDNSNKIASSYAGGETQHEVQEASTGHARKADHTKLLFLRTDIDKFDLQDLLRASAEVLGSGTFGASYKAVVLNGLALVVKRYRHMNNVGREEFHEHMRRLGRLKHPNLLPLMAYYYRKEEKLLVSEYMENGSLASHLHGNHSLEEGGLDWATRLKIVKGIARGLAYLYTELPIIVPHGHLKSSNVLLDESFEPLLTDYSLRPVINPDHAHPLMIAYKSPEYTQHSRTTRKTDIWCFGILILEILTGKFPENYLTQGYDSNADLATWVNNMVKEKKTSEVFDKEMHGTKDSKGEMINLLKIGLLCCEEDAERRPDIKEVVEKIEQLKEGDLGEDYFGSEGNRFSIRGNEDEFSLAANR